MQPIDYQVGDRVRIIAEPDPEGDPAEDMAGQIGEIVAIDRGYVVVLVAGRPYAFELHEVEHAAD